MEVDLIREYHGQIDLLDFYRGKLSLRRLIVFATELPEDSLLWTELRVRDIGTRVWDTKEQMLSNVIYELRYNSWLQELWLHGNSKDAEKTPPPEPPEMIYPPGYEAPPPEPITYGSKADFEMMMLTMSA